MLACGTGLFVRYLRERGVPLVFGADRSAAMLRVAAARNKGNHAHFVRQEFAALQLPQPVDLIICNFDSLNYLLATDDLLHALRRFRTNLRPGGHLICDMITDHPAWHGRAPHVERVTLVPASFVRVMRWDAHTKIQTARISISRNGRTQTEMHVQRGYPAVAVARLLGQAGFELRGAHDFETLGPITAQTSRAAYVARSVR